MQQKAQKLLQDLESKSFSTRLRLARLVEKFSGGGLVKKIQRLFCTPSVYLSYLFIVKARIYRRKSATAKLFWGRTITIPVQDYDSLALRAFGFAGGTEAELKLARFFIRNLEETDVLYDIGANYGFFTYLASELCKEVHSFEPIPFIASVVRENTTINKGVSVNTLALSNTAGTVDLHISESSGLSTINTATTNIHSYTYNESNKITVEAQTLDGYVTTHTPPTFIKIDVEGAEEQVIEGASGFLSTHAPVIAMEVWGKDNGGPISMQAVKRLYSYGYKASIINPDGTLTETAEDLSLIAPSHGGDNFIFTKS